MATASTPVKRHRLPGGVPAAARRPGTNWPNSNTPARFSPISVKSRASTATTVAGDWSRKPSPVAARRAQGQQQAPSGRRTAPRQRWNTPPGGCARWWLPCRAKAHHLDGQHREHAGMRLSSSPPIRPPSRAVSSAPPVGSEGFVAAHCQGGGQRGDTPVSGAARLHCPPAATVCQPLGRVARTSVALGAAPAVIAPAIAALGRAAGRLSRCRPARPSPVPPGTAAGTSTAGARQTLRAAGRTLAGRPVTRSCRRSPSTVMWPGPCRGCGWAPAPAANRALCMAAEPLTGSRGTNSCLFGDAFHAAGQPGGAQAGCSIIHAARRGLEAGGHLQRRGQQHLAVIAVVGQLADGYSGWGTGQAVRPCPVPGAAPTSVRWAGPNRRGFQQVPTGVSATGPPTRSGSGISPRGMGHQLGAYFGVLTTLLVGQGGLVG